MEITALHAQFGVEVTGIDLRHAADRELYPEIRALFEKHSLLCFPGQDLKDDEHTAFARLFGPLEDRSNPRMDRPVTEPGSVANVAEDGSLYRQDDMRLLDLRSNMLWHTDSTFLPVPALVNVLQARVVPSEGGATEFASSRAGFERLEPAMQARLRQLYFWHRYSHSRARIDPALANLDRFTMWQDQKWRAVWTNPVTGRESLYIASHAFAVDGMDDAEGSALIDSLIAAVTRREDVYAHAWTPGDLLVWDERAVLHRGTPWPYDQARSLVSLCVSAREVDGLASVSPPHQPSKNR